MSVRRGVLWVGARDGLYRLLADRRVERYPVSLPDNSIHSLMEDREGRLWAGTGRGGLWSLADSHLTSPAASRKYSDIKGLFQASDGVLWAGSREALLGFVNEDDHRPPGGALRRVGQAQATLFDDKGDQILTHFLSPNPAEGATPRATWQHSRDTSTVWGAAIASSSDPNFVAPGSIPWLLLQIVGSEYGPASGDKMIPTAFIQRVNTAGGIAPATGCSLPTDIGKKAMVPYTTDYVFYR